MFKGMMDDLEKEKLGEPFYTPEERAQALRGAEFVWALIEGRVAQLASND